MQQADGPPEQVDQWRLVINDPERIVWRRAWLAGSNAVGTVDTERRYQEIEISKNDLTDSFEVTFTDNTPSDTPGVAAFQTDRESEIGASASRQGAIKLAVEEMAINRNDIAGNVDEITDREWAKQRRPEPDFTGKALTDFEESDTPDTPDRTLRERLVDDRPSEQPVGGEADPFDILMPKEINGWSLNTVRDGIKTDRSTGFFYATDPTTDKPVRAYTVRHNTVGDLDEWSIAIKDERVSGFAGDTAVVFDTDDPQQLVNSLLRRLQRNSPSDVSHPRINEAVIDELPDEWELVRYRVTKRKTRIRWGWNYDREDNPDSSEWTIEYDGNTGTNQYQFKINAGRGSIAGEREEGATFQPTAFGVTLPPTPSLVALADRAGKIARTILANPTDPFGWEDYDAPNRPPQDELLPATEVAPRIDQLQGQLSKQVSDDIFDPPLGELMTQFLDLVDALDKRTLTTATAKDIQETLNAAQYDFRRAPIKADLIDVDATTFVDVKGEFASAYDAVVASDDHPRNYTDEIRAEVGIA